MLPAGPGLLLTSRTTSSLSSPHLLFHLYGSSGCQQAATLRRREKIAGSYRSDTCVVCLTIFHHRRFSWQVFHDGAMLLLVHLRILTLNLRKNTQAKKYQKISPWP